MIKILLVDNDAVIRQYITHTIDWRSLGAEIVAEAADGKEAFFLAVKHAPDIIITDIELPVCDGMELIANLRQIRSPAKIVIFTDARGEENLLSAIRLGVKEYLFKQTNLSYVKVAVKKICDQIAEEREYLDGLQRQKAQFQKHLREIQADFMNQLLREKAPAPAWAEEARQLGLNLAGPRFQALLFRCDPGQYWNALAFIEQYSQEFHPCVWDAKRGNLYAVLLNLKAEADSQSFLLHFTKQHKYLFYAGDQNFLLIPACTGLDELAAQYQIGLRLAECGMLFSGGELLCTRDWAPSATPPGLGKRFEREQRLVQGLKTCGIQDYEAMAGEYIQDLRAACSPDSQTRSSLYRILLAVAARENIPIANLDRKLREIQAISNAERLRCFLATLYREFGISSEYNSALIRDAKRYVEENYAQKISLNSIAKQSFVSPSYLSSLFHKETGTSFNQWLHQYRVERAKELLSTGKYKNYEIAAMVGYPDYKTFAKYFSRFTGKNAKEYKNQFVIAPRLGEAGGVREPS